MKRLVGVTALFAICVCLPMPAQSQRVTATLSAGTSPWSAAVNPVTNKIYVTNDGSSSVTVIDGATGNTSTVPAGKNPVSAAVNVVTNKIYVANAGSNNVTVIDGATNSTATVAAGLSPNAVAVDPVTDKIYVANQGGGNVTVIDGNMNTTTTVASGQTPCSVAVNPVTNKIYVANQGDGNVTVIDGSTNKTTMVTAGNEPRSVAVNPVTNKIYVANASSGTVTIIDGVTNSTTAVPAGSGPWSVALNPVTNKIYIADYNGSSVTVMDGLSNTTTNVAAGANPRSIAVNPITNQIYVANYQDAVVTVIDGASNTPTTLQSGQDPYSVAVNPVTDKIYVANLSSNNVTVIDGATNALTTVAPSNQAWSVAVNPVTNKIYVANYTANNATVIDGVTGYTTTVTTGKGPNSVAVNPATNKIYISNYGSNNVTVIDGATNNPATIATRTSGQSNDNCLIAQSIIAVNPVTNKIYVANCGSASVTVIDGANNATTTVATVGTFPISLAVNPATNKIYVANYDSSDVTVIDGVTNATTTLATGYGPFSIAVNSITNKVYVANHNGNSVTVIDGATNFTTTVAVGNDVYFVAVNPVTNKIYAANFVSNNVTVIDGASNATTTLAVSSSAISLAVNPVTNKVYVADYDGSKVTIIDGATNTMTSVAAGDDPQSIAVNPVTNQIFVANDQSSVTVINEAQVQASALTTKISTLPGNQTNNPNPMFTFTVQNTTATTPGAVYYQVDTWQNVWSVALGSNSTLTGSVASLQPGFHILYAFAVDGQESTSTQAVSPSIGNVQAYGFLVLPALLPSQTITFAAIATQNVGTPLMLGATASSGLPVTYVSMTPSICVVSGASTSFTSSGICTIVASQSGSSSYLSAPAISQSFTVTAGIALVSVSNLSFSTSAGSTSSVQSVTLTNAGSAPLAIASITSTNPLFSINNSCGIPTSLASGQSCTISVTFAPTSQTVVSGALIFTDSSSTGATQTITLSGNNTPSSALNFVPIIPCRIADTRNAAGDFGGPYIAGVTTRSIPIQSSSCNIPATAAAYALNVTVVPHTGLGYLTVWPTGQTQPLASTLNSDGRVKANAAIIPAGINGAVSFYASDDTDLVLDINGYFIPASGNSGLDFFPLTPCRIADTRNAASAFGSPSLVPLLERDFPILRSTCNVPTLAQAYSFNVTAVPDNTPLYYVTMWPTGRIQPLVSTLNAPTGAVTANAAILNAGTSGDVATFATNQTDLILDINGYFAPPAAAGLHFYAITPCRVLDSRNQFSTPQAGKQTISFSGACNVPNSASAVVVNATAVPKGGLGYLTLWPDGQSQPLASTLNSDGTVTANLAIVPIANGTLDAYASDPTYLIIDVNGYFAP